MANTLPCHGRDVYRLVGVRVPYAPLIEKGRLFCIVVIAANATEYDTGESPHEIPFLSFGVVVQFGRALGCQPRS